MIKFAYVGIDPGKDGFITIFRDNRYFFYPMPTHKVETGELLDSGKPQMRTEFYERGVMLLSLYIKDELKGYYVYGCIEQVTGRQGWSANNNFNFGHTAGMQKMLLDMISHEVIKVRPQKWQTYMYQGYEKIMKPSSTGKTMVHDTKATSKMVSEVIAPDIIFSRQGIRKRDGTTHKVHDGKTDSFLICLYCKNIFEV